jgi:PKHD-type hydroxylase
MIWFEPPDQQMSLYYLANNILSDSDFKSIEKYTTDNLEELVPARVEDAGKLHVDDAYRRTNIMFFKDSQALPDVYRSVVNAALSINDRHYKYNISYIEPLQYSVYESDNQGFYDIHCDTIFCRNSNGFSRKISFSILLNDPSEFEGGDLLFHTSNEPFKVNLQKNDMVMFPSFVPHSVTPVTNGVRKTLVGWICGPNFV